MKTGLKAWVAQRKRDIETKGKSKAPWVCYWNTPDGERKQKACGPGREGWRLAEKERQRLHGELITGAYENTSCAKWSSFRTEFDDKILSTMEAGNRRCTKGALAHFERLSKPNRMSAIKTQTIDGYIAKRRTERGMKKGDKVSPATINKELRYIKAVLRIANDWGYLPLVPKIRRIKEPVKLITYVTPEHFEAIYGACDKARKPHGQAFTPESWWKAFLAFTYMTGWRMGEPLSLRWDDVDLEAGTAITRHADNKGRRDELVPLHPVVVEHLQGIRSFDRLVFPWDSCERCLWIEFGRIQKLAGIHLACHGDHEHTESCYTYGFHDLRRSFATMNAAQLTGDALQAMMRHKSYTTTQKYVNMSRQLNDAVASLHVPEMFSANTGGASGVKSPKLHC